MQERHIVVKGESVIVNVAQASHRVVVMLLWPLYPANTKHLYNISTMLDQRRRRWADVVEMLYKCFVLAG